MAAGPVQSLQRRTRVLLSDTLPAHIYTVIRLSVGVVYLWFGILKFPFIPGGSPAGPLIATWGKVVDARPLTLGLALFETAMGLLLLLGWKVRLVAAILLVHALGTFATMILAADQIFNLRYGLYSLTLAGEFIVKNVLFVAAFFALAATTPRRHQRWPLLVPGIVKVGDRVFSMMTRDVSRAGLSFFCPAEAADALKVGEMVNLGIALPLQGRQLQLHGKIMHTSPAPEAMLLAGCELEAPGGLIEMLAPWLSEDGTSVARAVGPALRADEQDRN